MKKLMIALGILGLFLLLLIGTAPARADAEITFAVIGDFGADTSGEAAVAAMVAGWNPDFIVTTGDNYYSDAGGTGTEKYDIAIGKYYCAFLKDITTTGTFCPTGQATVNRFFTSIGDHDLDDAGHTNGVPYTYLEYVNLPGDGFANSTNNERYYDFVQGPVHFFVLNSDVREIDGATANSAQAKWLQTQLGASTSTWNIIISPKPPYSSGEIHGSSTRMQWPFAEWGADVVLSGDDHVYERIHWDGILYFVNGVGGQFTYDFGDNPVDGSQFQFTDENGAQFVTASDTSLTFEFHSIQNGGTLVDTHTITTPHSTPTPTNPAEISGWHSPSVQNSMADGDGNGFEVDPANVFDNDSMFALDMNSGTTTGINCINSTKDKHRFYNFDISIPDGATIQGIEVRLDALIDSIYEAPKMCVALSSNNGSNWTSALSTSTLSPSEFTYLVGGRTELWGRSWVPSNFVNGNFAVRITNIVASTARDFSLDWAAVKVYYLPICHPLTISHTGQGSDPVASPAKSSGCFDGEYVEGESITLTGAIADDGWQVIGWDGTNNDASTSDSNTVTMPLGNHEVSATYQQIPITVTFHANGGSGSMSNQVANVPTALTTNAFTRSGYSFAGWNTAANGSGASYADGASYSFASDVTLYAQWSVLPNHTVTFDANGGSGSMSNQVANVPTALTLNAFTRTGYSFTGWNTAANGSGTPYADSASYSFAADVTLYAQWTALPNHTVTFHVNGGSGSMSNQVANIPTALTTNAFTRSGYSFAGWNTAANGSGASYADGASYSFASDVTLYAQWSVLPNHTVTFDANGGSGSMSNQVANVPTALTSNTFTRSGYSFNGWNTAANGSDTAYADGASYDFIADLTLYAQWSDSNLPTVTTIIRASTSPTSASSVNFTVTFSEPVTGVDANGSDFTLTTSPGLPGAAITGVTPVSDSVYTVTVNAGSGSGTLRLDVNSATIEDLNGNPLAGLPFTSGEEYIKTLSLTSKSNASNDGWILESSETSNTGGSLNSSATNLILGDDAADRQYRAILHFDTSALPDTAVVTNMTLKIKQQGNVVGVSPFSFGSLYVDMRNPAFGNSSLELVDFSFAAKKVKPAVFNPNPVSGWFSARFNTGGKLYVNRTGVTQLRLYFSVDDNNNNIADFIRFYSGNASAGNRPKFLITYYVP